MSNGFQIGSPARVAFFGFASALTSVQTQFLHSLPIAGLVVTPDAIAERVLPNPRLRATIGTPPTGKGASGPVMEPGVVGTRADPPD
jgi:hypothetical protein